MSSVESELQLPSNSKTPEDHTNAAVIDLEEAPTVQQTHAMLQKNATEIMDVARHAFNSGRTKPVQFRKQQLKKLLLLLEENTSDFIEALKKDLGRPAMETLMLDINLCKNEVTSLIWNLEKWAKPKSVSKPFANVLDSLYIFNEPYGVVLVIGSWNFPVNLVLGPVAGAIAAGNCVVMKPSEVASSAEQLVAKLVPQYLDKECYHVYTGGAAETAELLQHKFDYVFFTGSTSTGRLVHAAANKHLTPVTLELGGKNPVYLDDTVDMERAAQRILFGKCSNAGQICISPDYLLCTKDVQAKFVTAVKKILAEWYNNDPQTSPHYCKIVSEKHYQRLVNFLEGKHDIALGGRCDPTKRFIEPTVITNVSLGDALMQEEIFGPILPIITVNHVSEAIAIINKGEKPLALYVFSNDRTTKNRLVEECSSGGVLVNDTLTQFIVDTLPFGGVGLSGMGRYHGKNTFDTFVHKKSVLEKGYSSILQIGLSLRYPPYSDFKIRVIDMLTKPRRGISYSTLRTLCVFVLGMLFLLILQFLYCLVTNK